MVNKLFRFMVLLVFILVFDGCNSSKNTYDKINKFPHKVEKIIVSPQGDKFIMLVKMGAEGGATVPFAYYFIFSDNKKDLFVSGRFLWVRGLKKYTIKWVSNNEINVTITARRVVNFKSQPFIKRGYDFKSISISSFAYKQ